MTLKMHQPRKLREMIKKSLSGLYGSGVVSDCSDELVDAVMRQVSFWLQDEQHADRMALDLKAQQVINRLRDNLTE